jgi:hypothetical protein
MPNQYRYDEAALAEKTRVLKELAQLYPDVNPLWCMMCVPTRRQTSWRR